MKCPACDGPTTVIETRFMVGGSVRRRRECAQCPGRFTTWETVLYGKTYQSRSVKTRTEREAAVVKMTGRGLSIREIAQALNVSESQIYTDRRSAGLSKPHKPRKQP